jgi:hypothetical protein
MAYPKYDITFIAPTKRLIKKTGEEVDSIVGIDGSHACVLKTTATRVNVNLKHHSPADPFPTLEITFTDAE